ncbi:EAL domain-containing protein [Stenotrophomonas sp. S4]
MDALSRVSAQVLDSALPSLPLYLLQATAVIGMIGVLLIATRRAGHAIEGRRLYVGVALGLIYLFNSWFVARYTQGVVKLHLGFDILLVSGLLGGWRGGLACLAAALLARYQFVGTQFFLPASLEAALQMMAGVWLRRRLHPRMLNELSPRMILQAWSVRIGMTALGLALGVAIIGADQLPVAELAIQRLLALPVSLLMLGAVFALVYNDAQIDAQRQREQAWLRVDPISGLPNMRALGERLQHFWRDNDGLGKACLVVVEMGNQRDLRLRYGPLQDNGLWHRDTPAEVHRLLPSLPVDDVEVYQFGDAALAILVRSMSLTELRIQARITELACNLADRVGRDWPGFRPLFRCAVVELKPPTATDEGHLPFRAITLALSAIESGVVFFDDPIQRDSEIDALIEVALERWLQQGDAPLCYQPKHRLHDRQLVGAEALLRMRDGEGRPIAPMRVISLLRRQGRLADLEWATLQSAVHFLQHCRQDGAALTVAVNVSAESLRLPDFGLRLQELLQLHDIPGAMLRLEIVEWTEIVERDVVDANIAQLLAAGITLSLDDFGAGYSTLILLSQLAIAEVKIEQALIATLSDAKSQSIVRFIVEVAHRCGAIVVAEGTETLAQEQQLRALGVDVGQGYLYSAALPADEFRRFAAN